MPRKPKPPMDFVIESLSSGKLSIPREEGVDDWGELIPVPEIYGPFRPLHDDPFAQRDAQRMQVVKDKLLALKLLGIVPGAESVRPKRVHKPFKRRM
jgi:hypothetical protein